MPAHRSGLDSLKRDHGQRISLVWVSCRNAQTGLRQANFELAAASQGGLLVFSIPCHWGSQNKADRLTGQAMSDGRRSIGWLVSPKSPKRLS